MPAGTQVCGHRCVKHHSSFSKRAWDQRYLLLILIPCLLYYIIFAYVPMAGLVLAFKKFNPTQGMFLSPWVGFRYFEEFIKNPYLFRLIRNTFLISFYSLVYGFPVPIIFALLLNEVRWTRYKKIVQTISYLPHFISIVIVMGILRQFVAADTGIINKMIAALGGEQINFFMSKEWFRTLYVSSDIWQGFGWDSIIYLAAMSAIDMQLYEAAIIDGAGRLRQMWHVTLPGILPTIMILLIMKMGNLLNVGYEKIILMYNPGTYEVADVISTYVYRSGLQDGNYSFATAVGLLNSIVALVFLTASNFLSRKLTDTSLW